MIKHFCDNCEAELKPSDALPIVRIYGKLRADIIITNLSQQPVNEICYKCKLQVVTDGEPPAGVAQPPSTTMPSLFEAAEPPKYIKSLSEPATQPEESEQNG